MEFEVGKAYQCKTLEDAKEFLQECDKQGIAWRGNTKASSKTNWSSHKDKTCYYVEEFGYKFITYSELSYFIEHRIEVVVYCSLPPTPEEIAARDLAWKQLMQIEEHKNED